MVAAKDVADEEEDAEEEDEVDPEEEEPPADEDEADDAPVPSAIEAPGKAGKDPAGEPATAAVEA